MKIEERPPKAMAKRLWHIVRAVYFMLRKGVIKRKLMMDLNLQLLLERGKILGKAIGNLLTFHHHDYYSAFTCRSVDPIKSFYTPREVEFSCSNTPSYPSFHATKRKNRHQYEYDVAAIAMAFEILNSEISSDDDFTVATPSPVPVWSYKKSPVAVRQLRITDSPFPLREEEGETGSHVDKEAEEFIRRFYEQLRLQQQQRVGTPEPRCRRHEPLLGRA